MFEPFTLEARDAFTNAEEVARSSGHGWVGTEHLLLALALGDGPTVAHSLLRKLNLRSEDLRKEILAAIEAATPPEPGSHSDQSAPLITPRLRYVAERSVQVAVELGADAISTGHVLLALVAERVGIAAAVMERHGVDPRVLTALSRSIDHRSERPSPGPHWPLTAATASALRIPEIARQEAVRSGPHGQVSTMHQLLALLADDDSIARKTLAQFGVTREVLARQGKDFGGREPSVLPEARTE